MSIKTGTEGGGAFKRGRKSFQPGQVQKPLRPLENPFPEKKPFRLGQYLILQADQLEEGEDAEKDDYIICKGFDPNAENPFGEFTPSTPIGRIKIAKPPALQRTPWEDSVGVEINGVTYTYEYDDDEVGVRTAIWTIGGVEFKQEQRIEIPYTLDDEEVEHQVLIAVEIRKNAGVDGMDVEDENGTRLRWMDLNVSGRHWANAEVDWEGVLSADLSAASNGKTGATTGTVTLWVKDPDNDGHLMDGLERNFVNRSIDLSASAGTYCNGTWINGERRIQWIDC